MNPVTILEHSDIPFSCRLVGKLPQNRKPVLIAKPLAIGLQNASGALPYGVVETM
jgi:predicted component of type VI protein secretion system